MKPLIILCTLLFISACAPYQSVSPVVPTALNLAPRQQPVKIFYPAYRMPERAYYEMGVFSYELPVYAGSPDNQLSFELKQRNLDGAIILDRSRTWGLNNVEYETLTCMGLLFADNVRDFAWVNRVEVAVYQDSVLAGRVDFTFSPNGQISGTKGEPKLIRLARAVQPWFFIQQKNSGWKERPSGTPLPHRQLKERNNYTFWKNQSREDSLFYSYQRSDIHHVEIFLEQIGNDLVPKTIYEGKQAQPVENVFLVDRLKKQVWHRRAYGQKLVYRYHYLRMSEQNIFPLVEPEDLQQ